VSNPNGNPDLPPGGGPNRHPPLRAYQKLALYKDLAAGELSFSQLAEKHGRHKTWVHDFAHRPDTEQAVRHIREAKYDALAGLWAANKANRVAELQASAERLTAPLPDGVRADPAAERAAQAALRAIAEELGQLTQKIEGTFTRYVVDGANLDDLT
jgi:hypothetical protein